MNVVERLARRADEAQQGIGPIAFAVGVFKKFGDDRGGSLAALLTFYGFLSLFPLLLLLVTILGFFGGSEHSFVQRVENSAFSQFPVVGTKLSTNIHGLQGRSVFGLVVGILFVLWGSQGALQTAQYAQAEIWNIPGVSRPSFLARLGRTASMMVVLGLFLLASTILAGLVTIGHHGGWAVVGAVVVSLAVNIGLFVVAFRLLTPKQIPWRDMVPGAIVGALGWTALQYLGGVLVEHSLRNTSKEYGTFALVLGLISFLYLAAQVTLYASELNVVRVRHLWPRGMVQPPLTAADKEVLSSIALEGKRRPEQYVSTGFRADPPAEGKQSDSP
ncbi:MAG: YihY/virulence factor BrkB family protein [Acidimicrobiales bacterium]